MKLEYTRIGDYELPNLTLKKQSNKDINKYGRLRLNYLKENNKTLYTTLLMTNELINHLVSVSNEAELLLQTLMENYKKLDKKLAEKSKELNQLEWVKLINNYKNMAEEIILKELIFI
ncbi:TnpV protein [Amedibacillus sp. YH-ame10]